MPKDSAERRERPARRWHTPAQRAVLNDDFSANNLALMKDLLMLIANEDARERSETEYRDLLGEAGFAVEKIMRFDAPRDLVVARKRGA